MIDEKFVLAAARALELDVPAALLPGITANLQRVGEVAGPLFARELAVEDEPAPVWRP